MRTVGEILSEKRKAVGLSLEEIEKETKIRVKYLEAIEKNNFSQIPGSATVKGFIRNYALVLGLTPANVLAVFRRDFRENEKGQIVPRGMTEPLNRKDFYWTPKTTFLLTVFLVVGGFIFFFFRQYLKFISPPPLEVFSPQEGQVFPNKVEVVGKTDKDATVRIDGTLISLSEKGQFKEEIILPRGENVVTIEAANRQGKKTVVNRKVIVGD
ncbi:MAG: helix-turn-helix domain-containing protein [Microgenomates group bacterium]